MNLYFLEVIIKFLRMLLVAFISIFNINIYSENENNSQNMIVNKNNYAINVVKIDNTVQDKTPNITIKKEEKVTKVESNNKVNTSKIIKKNEKKDSNKIITTEKPKVSLAEYTGRLTGYGPDCVGCTGSGNLACKTRNKKTHSLVKDGIYYNDSEYGKVRILAAATTKFKCGTIVVVSKEGAEPFVGIVLDTGGSMINAWNKGIVWMDLAYKTNVSAGSDNLTGKNIKFSVQRWGW
mgnify:FL=1